MSLLSLTAMIVLSRAMRGLTLSAIGLSLVTARSRSTEPYDAGLAFVPVLLGRQTADTVTDGAMVDASPFTPLLRRQSSQRPSPVRCSGGVTCCPAGTNCRPDLGVAQCCPTDANSCGGIGCATAGSTCCGNPPKGVCRAGTICTPTGCCEQGWTVCQDARGECKMPHKARSFVDR